MVPLNIASLSSSSTYGNAYIVWEDSKRPILIDCGMSLKRMVASLEALGMTPRDLAALFITHEHSDHVRALCLKNPLPEKYHIPVYASRGFWEWYLNYRGYRIDLSLVNVVESGQRVRTEGYRVQAFSKPHDALDPLGFIVEGSTGRVCFVMDLGHVPYPLEALLRGTEYLFFESNHDVDMELRSGRPRPLIDRVLGAQGHLSNTQAADSISRLATKDTREIVLCHLSIDCNSPEVALTAVQSGLKRAGLSPVLSVAPPGELAVYGSGRAVSHSRASS